jgi:anti-sigma factor RsiW
MITMSSEDAELVALIDNELDENAKARLLARLVGDETLRKRYESLRDIGPPIAASLDALIDKAPIAHLRAALPREDAPRAARRPLGGIALRELAAGIVIGLLAAGAAAWVALSFAPHEEREDWRAAVVEYMDLYTNDTFAFDDMDPSIQAKKLSAIGDKVGTTLTPDRVAIPGLHFETAQMLSYDGAPLGEIAYVDAKGAPVLFCIIADGRADAQARSERRGDYSLTSWSHAGRGYLAIGRLPEQQIADLARTLEGRFL